MLRVRFMGNQATGYAYSIFLEDPVRHLWWDFTPGVNTWVANPAQPLMALLQLWVDKLDGTPRPAGPLTTVIAGMYGLDLPTPVGQFEGDYYIYYYRTGPTAGLEFFEPFSIHNGEDLTVLPSVQFPATARANLNMNLVYPPGTDVTLLPQRASAYIALAYNFNPPAVADLERDAAPGG